jgi:acyl-coenzyme A synthetase/AMP-(fatty) acid ligase
MTIDTETSLDIAQSVFDLIFNKNPNNVPEDTCTLISEDRTITFGELKNLVLKCAYNLKEKYGITKGDVVAVRAITHIEYPLVLHGTVCGGNIYLYLGLTFIFCLFIYLSYKTFEKRWNYCSSKAFSRR